LHWRAKCVLYTYDAFSVFAAAVNFVLGGLLGVLGGLFGIGGGLIAIPVLGFMYGMDQQLAQGTALVMIVLTGVVDKLVVPLFTGTVS